MKILVITLPQRDTPSGHPPLGALSIINYARKHSGQDVQVELFNIDAHRPTYEEALEYICKFSPDILGISAVLSTAYAYTKRLSLDIKRLLPDTLIVVGGNLGASAEILLRKAGVDLCVLGEGEKVFLNIINHAKATCHPPSFNKIPGIALLDDSDKFINTGYETPLAAEEIWCVDWADLERDGTLDLYFPIFSVEGLGKKFISLKEGQVNAITRGKKRLGGLACSKGCVSRCTFCHRWDKGIRHIPVDVVMKQLEFYIEKYNVGVVNMLAETFGSDKRWLKEFLEKVKPYNILWAAYGVRTSVVDPDLIRRMKDAGCYCIGYGNETGSSKILEVMEKKVTLQDNYNAAKWTIEAELNNAIQLVIGMPGETPETIRETIEYVNYVIALSPLQDPRNISVNYAQALPGTPLYEFGRACGLIGREADSEEEYLLAISDRDASDPLTTVNFTNYPRLTQLSWNLLIRIEACHSYVNKFGMAHYCSLLLEDNTFGYLPEVVMNELKNNSSPTIPLFFKLLLRGKFNAMVICYPRIFYHLRRFAGFFMLVNMFKRFGAHQALVLCIDYAKYILRMNNRPWKFQYRSLRKIVDEESPQIPTDSIEMKPLRKGR